MRMAHVIAMLFFFLFLDWCAISWFIRAFNRKDLAVSLSTTHSDKDVDSSIRPNRIGNTTPYKIDAMDCCRIFCLFSPIVSVLCWFMWAYFDPIFTRPTKSELAKYIYTQNTHNNSKPMKRIEIKTYEDRMEVLCDFYWFSVYIFIVRFKFNLEIYLMLLFFSVVGFVYGFVELAGCIGNCCIICVSVCVYVFLFNANC